MKYYNTVSTRKMDEFIDYEGYNRDKAIEIAQREYEHLTAEEKRKTSIEVREFIIDKPWNEYTEKEQDELFCLGYNLIDWKEGERTMKELNILINCIANTKEAHDDLFYNFSENYSDIFEDYEYEEEKYLYKEETGELEVIFSGKLAEDYDDEDVIRLTHHAEGLYNDTDIEHTHVEVCIDGTWYGR